MGKITIKEYVDVRFKTLHSTINKTARQLDKRLNTMNEFRQQLNDQTKSFINRSEHESLTNRVNSNENKISNFEGRSWAIGVGFTILSATISIILHYVH